MSPSTYVTRSLTACSGRCAARAAASPFVTWMRSASISPSPPWTAASQSRTIDSMAGDRADAAGRARPTSRHASDIASATIRSRAARHQYRAHCSTSPTGSTASNIARASGVPFLPEQRPRECYRRKQHDLAIPEGRCSRIGGAAGLLGLVQLCEVGLCEAEIHHRLDRMLGGCGCAETDRVRR